MKCVTRQDKGFRRSLNDICHIMPAIRSIYMQVDRIEFHDKGILFFDQNGEKLSSISRATFQQERQAHQAIFNPEAHQLL